MSDIGNAIKYLYDKFLLRDLLSFVTPGAIVIISIFLAQYDLCKILEFSKSISFMAYIPIFATFFIVGFGIQCFGAEVIKKLSDKYPNCRIIPSIRIKFHNRKSDEISLQKYAGLLKQRNEDLKLVHERFIVLKQMCANNAYAILIALILFLVANIALWLSFLLLSVFEIYSLFVGHKAHLERQEIWENNVQLPKKYEKKPSKPSK